MAPTEATILTSFLQQPASLPTIISLKSFTEFFPRSEQSSPQVKTLYRDLQHQRTRLTDAVGRNIAAEVKRGNLQRRAVIRARRQAENEEKDDEGDIENAMFGPTSNLPLRKSHTLTSIIPELEAAAEDIEDEMRRMEAETEELLQGMKNAVGGLSDLRYGRLANGQLRDQVLEGLERLENSCKSN